MNLNAPQRLFLRQYRELHESRSPKRVILTRLLKVFLGSVAIVGVMSVSLYLAGGTAYVLFIPFGVGIVLGNSATNLGNLMRRAASWSVVEEITNWPKVYEMLDGKDETQNK